MGGRKPLELTGQRFGKLYVVSQAQNKNGNTYWNCICDCGNNIVVKGVNLKHGTTQSCNCINRAITSKRNRDNADGIYRDSRLYRIYYGMRTRCYNKDDISYDKYGARGITICDEWLNDFLAFQSWAINNGYKDGLTIDRIDNNCGYYPENCRWATIKEQSNNRRSNVMLSYNNEIHSVAEWSDIVHINRETIYCRLRKGWTPEEALSIPTGKYIGGKYNHVTRLERVV